MNTMPENLHALLSERDGEIFYRENTSSRARAGRRAGYLRKDGYWQVRIAGRHYQLHRVIYAMHFGDPGDTLIDHKDGNPSNNRIENLRTANNTENLRNRGAQRNNTTGAKGVSWCERDWKYQAYAQLNGKTHNLGRFNTVAEASAAYQAFAKLHHKEFYHDKS